MSLKFQNFILIFSLSYFLCHVHLIKRLRKDLTTAFKNGLTFNENLENLGNLENLQI